MADSTETKPVDPCYLKPGETCQWCNYTRPKKQPVTRTLCKICQQPFTKGQKKRLNRGKWVHNWCLEEISL